MSRFISCIILVILSFSSFGFDNKSKVALFFGTNPPLEELRLFNVAIVQPQPGLSPKEYNTAASELFAYVSVGELAANEDNSKIKSQWKIGKNTVWKSAIMDLNNPEWTNYLLNQVITPLWDQGYRGFFLDTLDSYHALNQSAESNQKQLAGIVNLIREIKKKYPSAKIITNRGFDVIDLAHQDIAGVAVESLYSGWNNKTKSFVTVSEKDRNYLLGKLNKITTDYNLPVIVIDYAPQSDKKLANDIVEKIQKLGFIPWVTDPYLETVGIGLESAKVLPRKILMVYNGSATINNIRGVNIFKTAGFVLNYMGYIPILQKTEDPFPDNMQGFAGIITAFDAPDISKNYPTFQKWITKQIQGGIPVVFLENFGVPVTSPLLNTLGIKVSPLLGDVKKIEVVYQDKIMGYEIMPQPISTNLRGYKTTQGKVLYKLKGGNGIIEDSVAITPWGGYALSPYNLVTLPNNESRWVINPFEFFKQALRLPLMPIPDVTTESGRRILTIHIDGDGFISRVPWKENSYGGDVILNDIIGQYKLPVTVSLIQREIELIQPDKMVYNQLKNTAKKIFALPYVQMATHTYSHPLEWSPLVEGQLNTQYLSYPDKNYLFSYEKEIPGSAAFMNREFAPPGKKVETVFWSGEGDILEKPLALANDSGLRNINRTSILYLRSNKSLTNLNPLGIYVGKYFQIFAPIPNDFQYTDKWTPPLTGFANVLNTFALTENPVRYKPISIYYHFYSGIDQGALRSLVKIYNWAVKQYITPLQIVDYIDKVVDFNRLIIAQAKDNSWIITNNGTLREFRVPKSFGYPDLINSTNILGFNTANNDVYIHLGSAHQSNLRFTKDLPTIPYLIDANAQITAWKVMDKNTTRFVLKGYVPLHFKLANMQNCTLQQDGKTLSAESKDTYSIKGVNSGTFEIRCA